VTTSSSVDEVVAALSQPEFPTAVATAARVIERHCHPNHMHTYARANRVAYATAGAIHALVAAGTMHLNHAGVAEAVCRAFCNLIYQNDANSVRFQKRDVSYYYYFEFLYECSSFFCLYLLPLRLVVVIC
jgi:hypothetical protein